MRGSQKPPSYGATPQPVAAPFNQFKPGGTPNQRGIAAQASTGGTKYGAPPQYGVRPMPARNHMFTDQLAQAQALRGAMVNPARQAY